MVLRILTYSCLVFGACFGLVPSSAKGSIVFGFEQKTSNGNADVTSQLLATIEGVSPNKVQFTFSNEGPIASTIYEIYFLDPNGRLTGPGVIGNSIGTDYKVLGNLNFSEFPSPADFAFKPQPPPATNGVDPGELVSFTFTGSAGDVMGDLNAGILLLGIHVGSIGGAGSEKFVGVPQIPHMPEPASVFVWSIMGLSIAVVAYRRRNLGR